MVYTSQLPTNHRLLQRGQMRTMDFLPNRLNVTILNNVIQGVSFG
jgi:hypothetical protein